MKATMSAPAFTPGPWRVEPFSDDVAKIWGGQQYSTNVATVPHVDAQANARLIAAAPELYEALRAIVDQEQHDGDEVTHMHDMADLARAALARVEEKEAP